MKPILSSEGVVERLEEGKKKDNRDEKNISNEIKKWNRIGDIFVTILYIGCIFIVLVYGIQFDLEPDKEEEEVIVGTDDADGEAVTELNSHTYVCLRMNTCRPLGYFMFTK